MKKDSSSPLDNPEFMVIRLNKLIDKLLIDRKALEKELFLINHRINKGAELIKIYENEITELVNTNKEVV